MSNASIVNNCIMSNNLTEHRCYLEMSFLYLLCVCGVAWVCVYVLVFILAILHKVIINVIQTNLLDGF